MIFLDYFELRRRVRDLELDYEYVSTNSVWKRHYEKALETISATKAENEKLLTRLKSLEEFYGDYGPL